MLPEWDPHPPQDTTTGVKFSTARVWKAARLRSGPPQSCAADRRVEDDVRSFKCQAPRRFREYDVVAYKNPDTTQIRCLEDGKRIAGRFGRFLNGQNNFVVVAESSTVTPEKERCIPDLTLSVNSVVTADQVTPTLCGCGA